MVNRAGQASGARYGGEGARCRLCGDKIAGVHDPANPPAICEGCHLDAMLPRDYEEREDYAYDPAFGHSNARRSPSTGVRVLDDRPGRIADSRHYVGVRLGRSFSGLSLADFLAEGLACHRRDSAGGSA